jgi:hypothetical protein
MSPAVFSFALWQLTQYLVMTAFAAAGAVSEGRGDAAVCCGRAAYRCRQLPPITSAQMYASETLDAADGLRIPDLRPLLAKASILTG